MDVIQVLTSLKGRLAADRDSVKRKRSWDPAIKSVTIASYNDEIEALEVAIRAIHALTVKATALKNMPEFKSHDERDAYFRDNAEYFTCVRKITVGNNERTEHKSLENAVEHAQRQKPVTGGRYMIYAVIGEQSAMVTTVV